MTRREFMEMVIAECANEEIKAFAKEEIEKMNSRNAKRSATPSKTALANEPIKAKIAEVLAVAEEPMTASQVAEKVKISTQKASALLRQIEGLAVTEVKVKGKGKVKGYAIG